ncbi:MAG TPA: hypothetical protein VH054_29540 [Polyangiaceae bacterium]|nr:hypothetical protein [Polyangiaceae bacterium]
MRAWLAASSLLVIPMMTGVARADVPDEIKVHVDGDPNLVVERKIEDTDLWESVCTGTCDRKLPLVGRYRLLGRGIRESLWIALVPPEHDALKLDVHAAYSTAWGGGIALVALGATTMFAGTVGFIVGASQHQEEFPCINGCPAQPENHSVAIAGGMSFIVGALMLGGGIGAILLGSQTRVRQVTATMSARGLSVTF